MGIEILIQNQFFILKLFWSINNLGPKNEGQNWVKKNNVYKICPKEIWINKSLFRNKCRPENFGPKTIFVPKNLFVQINFGF